MKVIATILIALLIAQVSIAQRSHAQEPKLAWPRFRGPNGAGIADGQSPPTEFGPGNHEKWRTEIPSGLSSPIIASDKLILTAFDEGKLLTIAYSIDDGKESWRAEAPYKQLEVFHKTEGSPAASTCATDGRRIVSYFGSCGLFCYDLSGAEQWRLELPPSQLHGEFGAGVSPIIEDGLVYLVRDQKQDALLYAVDLATGKVRWKTPRQSPTSYCTPVIFEGSAGKMLVAAGHGRIHGYDLKTGAERWAMTDTPAACCASPVVSSGVIYFAGSSNGATENGEAAPVPAFEAILKSFDADKDGVIVKSEGDKAFGGFFDNLDFNKDGKIVHDEWESMRKGKEEGKDSAFALQLESSEKGVVAKRLWHQTKGLPYVPTALVVEGRLITVRDGGIVSGYKATSGERIFQERIAAEGKYYASPIYANGHLYLTSLEGVVSVLKLAADKPELIAKNLFPEERFAATPAVAGNAIYIRTDKHLWCFH